MALQLRFHRRSNNEKHFIRVPTEEASHLIIANNI